MGDDIKNKNKKIDAEYTFGNTLGKINFKFIIKTGQFQSYDDNNTFHKPYVQKRHYDKPSNKKNYLGKPSFTKKRIKKKLQEKDIKFQSNFYRT